MKTKQDPKEPEPTTPNELAVQLDLDTASNVAFIEAVTAFYAWSKKQPPLGPLGIENGWHNVIPLRCQDFLRRNASNRPPSLAPIKKYHYSMGMNDWRRTGQGLVFNVEGRMNEGQQRCWAAYFGGHTFDTYIVTDAPVEPDMFAYYDDVDRRTEADALHTSGLDGISSAIASAALLSYRYELGAIEIFKQPKIHRPNTREVLAYSRSHISLADTAHLIFPTYGKAVSLIKHKAVAIVFAERVIALYGNQALDQFFIPLGNGANLDEGSPVLGLRNRLLIEERISKERCLALVIKAFNYFMTGKMLPKSGLYVRDIDRFPTLEAAAEQNAE
jgi:hypothetical protein